MNHDDMQCYLYGCLFKAFDPVTGKATHYTFCPNCGKNLLEEEEDNESKRYYRN